MTKETEQIIHAQMVSKNVLKPDEKELYELSQLAGIVMDPDIFKNLLGLLKLNVPPIAIVQTLRSMCSSHQKYQRDENQPPSSSLASGEPHPSHRGRSASGERHGQTREGSERSHAQSSSARLARPAPRPHSYAADTLSEASSSMSYKVLPQEKRSRAYSSREEVYSSRGGSGSRVSSDRIADSERRNKKNPSYR